MAPKSMATPIIKRATAERHPRRRAASATPLATRLGRGGPSCSTVTVAGDGAGTIVIEASLSRRRRATGRDRPHPAGVAPARWHRRLLLPRFASLLASCSLTPTSSSSPRRSWWNPIARARQGSLLSDARDSPGGAGEHRRAAHVLRFSQVARHRLVHRSAHRLGRRRASAWVRARRAAAALALAWVPSCRVDPAMGRLVRWIRWSGDWGRGRSVQLAFGPVGSQANRLLPRQG